MLLHLGSFITFRPSTTYARFEYTDNDKLLKNVNVTNEVQVTCPRSL